jgi:ribosomal protein L7/L12
MASDNISTEQRLAAIEAKLDLLLARLGVDQVAAYGGSALSSIDRVPAAGTDPVFELVRGDKPIQAIKLHRELTGASLRESKAVIDAMKASLKAGRG